MKKVIPNDAVLVPEPAKRVFDGEIFDVYQWPQTMFDGSQETFEMLKRSDTTIVIAAVDDKVMIIEDEQPHTGVKLGFPGGRIDKTDDSTLAAAQREMREETGYEFKNWRLVDVQQPHSKIEWFIYFYLAWDGQKVTEPKLDVGEKIRPSLKTFAELKQLVLDKAGYLGHVDKLFAGLSSSQDLLKLSEFTGREVER